MQSKKTTELSNEELIKKEKTTKTIIPIFAGMLITLFALAMYITLTQKFTALMVMPFSLSPILVLLVRSRAELKQEMKNRGLAA